MALLKLTELYKMDNGTIETEIIINSENIEAALPITDHTRIEMMSGRHISVKENLDDIIKQAQTGKPEKTIIGSKKTPGLTPLS